MTKQQVLHEHIHDHTMPLPHAYGRSASVTHTHGHRHTGVGFQTKLTGDPKGTWGPHHRMHSHTAEEEADLRRQQLR